MFAIRRCFVFMLTGLLTVAGNLLAETEESSLPSRPLNLSLPRDAAWMPTVRNDIAQMPGGREATQLPDLGGRPRHIDGQGHLPYGSGYEARQRGLSPGGGFGRGGMGRGR